MLGTRTSEQVTAATLAGTQRINEIDQILNANVTDDPLADLINAADPVQAWQDTPIGSKRILIDRLATVTILPIGRGGRGFRPVLGAYRPQTPPGRPAAVTG